MVGTKAWRDGRLTRCPLGASLLRMASIRSREWTTKTGKLRSGWEVSWYEGKRRRKKVFSGLRAQARAKQLRGRIEGAQPDELTQVEPTAQAASVTTIAGAGERWVRYVERELGRERSTWGK
jgi:hypothetical protein